MLQRTAAARPLPRLASSAAVAASQVTGRVNGRQASAAIAQRRIVSGIRSLSAASTAIQRRPSHGLGGVRGLATVSGMSITYELQLLATNVFGQDNSPSVRKAHFDKILIANRCASLVYARYTDLQAT